jgi:ribonuclease Z
MKHESEEEHIMSDEAGADQRPVSRRDALKAAGLAGAAALSTGAVASAQTADKTPIEAQARNPYGGVPSGGITFPQYYRPTPYLASNNIYYPGQEAIGPDEMRISFIGSTPIPVTRVQAGTCIMVELGSGKRFFFDFGSGCMRNIIAMAVPLQTVNDIFFTHLHVDHYADLPYLFAFAPWMGRWKPLRVHGPSGRTPKDGIKHMIEGMKMMTHWHTDSFNASPMGDGYEVEVNEFDFRDDNGICYNKDGVTIRHWRRSHTKDGASAYRLDWNGLSFVWTGDGRPDELSLELAKGVDVFVTEVQPDTANLTALKFGMPPIIAMTTIDQAHSPHYAVGYMFNKIQPRLAMVTHMSYDEELIPEIIAGIRVHYSGFFQFGAPDVVVVNVTKDAIWTRKAALPEAGNMARPSPREAIDLFDLSLTNLEIKFPDPRHTVADMLEQTVRDREIDPKKYYPPDVYREPQRNFPNGFKIDVREMVVKKVREKIQTKLSGAKDNLQKLIEKLQGD